MLHQFFWPLPYIHTHTLRLFQFLVLELTSFGPFYSNPKTKLEEKQYLCFLKTRELPIFISLKLELELRTYV